MWWHVKTESIWGKGMQFLQLFCKSEMNNSLKIKHIKKDTALPLIIDPSSNAVNKLMTLWNKGPRGDGERWICASHHNGTNACSQRSCFLRLLLQGWQWRQGKFSSSFFLSFFDGIMTVTSPQRQPKRDGPVSKMLSSPIEFGSTSRCWPRWMSLEGPFKHRGRVFGWPANQLFCSLVPMDRFQKRSTHSLSTCNICSNCYWPWTGWTKMWRLFLGIFFTWIRKSE